MELTPFRSVEHPARFRLEHRPKGLFKRLLLKQKTAFRILDRNSKFLAVLILRHFSSEVIQLNGYFVQFPGTQQTHFCAGRSAVDNFGTQAINYQPSAILLVFIPVEKPTSLVGNTFDIEAFRCCAARFTNSYGQFTASLKDLRKVYDSMSQPFLKFLTVSKGYGVLARTSFILRASNTSFSCSAEFLHHLANAFVPGRSLWQHRGYVNRFDGAQVMLVAIITLIQSAGRSVGQHSIM